MAGKPDKKPRFECSAPHSVLTVINNRGPTKGGLSKPVGEPIIRAGNVDGVTRIDRYAAVSSALTLLGDQQVARLLDTVTPIDSSGVGGAAGMLTVAGERVFVKRVPLTELERRPEHRHSTANLFGLPPWCQYGVLTPGFGAWRELAAHVMTTNWVLSGACGNFPMLYHWRVVDTPPPVREDFGDIDAFLEYLHHGDGVRERVEALVAAEASVVLFMEYFPHVLSEWLPDRLAAGDVEVPCAMVERDLLAVTEFMERRGLFHFDTHFGNILTDGERLYLGDLGLAVSTDFDLSPAEREFLDHNAGHDRCYAVAHLSNMLVRVLGNVPGGPLDRYAYLADFPDDAPFPAAAADIIRRYRPVTVHFNTFFAALHGTSRQTPYPRVALSDSANVVFGSVTQS
jgi:hypothetical protein